VFNTALMTAQGGVSLDEMRASPELWGRLAESAVGAHLANEASVHGATLHYWRDGNREVDFVYRSGRRYAAIEVKSGRDDEATRGLSAFADRFKPSRTLVVGSGGVPFEEFLTSPAARWLG
jgi:predicted AAA+ superfamily ATPase